MKLQQIRNLQIIYDTHLIRRTLFKKYDSVILSFVVNIIILLSVLFFVLSFFWAFYYLFANYGTFYDALSACCMLSVSSSFFLAVGKESDFLFKNDDFLLSLPILKSERFIAIQISIYKSEILISLFFFIALALSIHSIAISSVFLILICALISPIVALPFSIIAGYWLNVVLKRRKKSRTSTAKGFKFKSFCIKCEMQNLFRFPSLIVELISQIIFYLIVIIISLSDFRFLGLFLVYNSLSSINTTSFSREGRMYDFLRTLPLNPQIRYMPKIALYLLFSLPLLFICMLIVAIVSTSYGILFYFVPLAINLINITLIGLEKGASCPKVDWVNRQDALQFNYGALISCLAVTLVTSIMLFFNPLVENQFINALASMAINVLVLGFNIRKL